MTHWPAWLRCVGAAALLACFDAPKLPREEALGGRDDAAVEAADSVDSLESGESTSPVDADPGTASPSTHTGTLRITGPRDFQVVSLTTKEGVVLPLVGAHTHRT